MTSTLSVSATAATCLACGSELRSRWSPTAWRMPDRAREFGYFTCPDCGSIGCAPLPTDEELGYYYQRHFNYDWYVRHFRLKRIQAWHRWRRMQRVFAELRMQPGRMLDIGCGHGHFLNQARRGGWDVVGVDYPSKATQHGREVLGLNLVEENFNDAVANRKLEANSFDFITAWHCIEHTTDPQNFVERARTLLKPGGKLLLAVPNAECDGMKLRGEAWVWCQQPFVHVIQFSGRGISRMVANAGLKVCSVWSRNTWDAQPLFDASIEPKIRTTVDRLNRRSWRLGFAFEEGTRLLCYAAGCFSHWAFGRECKGMEGSELLILVERVAD